MVLAMTAVVVFAGCFSMPSSASQREMATVTINNQTGVTVWYLYMSERTDTYWGDDWLGSEVIMDGDSYTARILTGRYDIMLEDRNGDTYTAWITVTPGRNSFTFDRSDKD